MVTHVEVIREKSKFTTTVILNLFLVAYIVNLKEILPSVYKLGLVFTLVYRYFRIFSRIEQNSIQN